MDVSTVQLVPFFPVLRGLPAWARTSRRELEMVPALYLPGVMKHLDARWLARALLPVVERQQMHGGVDVIDAHFGFPDGAAAVHVAGKLGVPVVVTLRGVEHEQIRTERVGRRLRSAIRGADGCICVSHSLAELALENGVSEEALTVIPNGVDAGVFNTLPAQVTREQLNLPTGRPIIVAVGHVIPRKQYQLLIKALHSGFPLRERPLLCIVGSRSRNCAYSKSLGDLIDVLDLRDSVRFVGEQPPSVVAAYLKVADCFATVSSREGCCNALLEALACGVPVVATAAGDNPLFITRHGGRLVEPDVRSIAAALTDTMGLRGGSVTHSAVPINDWGQVGRDVLGFFTKVLGRRATEASLPGLIPST